ncbi:hypothetical protein THRCLA_21129 [Thraustotheca clavata]|uniref:Uncharacterized protein n=1 Tax=Thraustotheca clavata TaxID=74557 RepID=A0A1V9ZZW0_9STRA|nr:hypothetical protein THRCLA_21129 [Thraustotheca clavata]
MFVSSCTVAILRHEVEALQAQLNAKTMECAQLYRKMDLLQQVTLDQSTEIKNLKVKAAHLDITHNHTINQLYNQLSILRTEKMDQEVPYTDLKVKMVCDRKKYEQAKIHFDQEINCMRQQMSSLSESYTQHLETCCLKDSDNFIFSHETKDEPNLVQCTVDSDQIVLYFRLVNDLSAKFDTVQSNGVVKARDLLTRNAQKYINCVGKVLCE